MYVKKNSSKFHRSEKINQSFLYHVSKSLKCDKKILKENLPTWYTIAHAMK